MIHDKLQDNTPIALYFFLLFSPSLCEIAYLNQRFERNDIISLNEIQICAMVFSPLNRCWPLYRLLMQEKGDTVTRLGLDFRLFKALTAVGKLKI